MMRILSISLKASMVLALVLSTLGTQATAENALLMSDVFAETLRPAANTGGARVMGFQIEGNGTATELFAHLPDDWAGEVFCVRTSTSDGLYDSENSYRAPVDTSEPVLVPHVRRSSFADKLTVLERHGFAVRIVRAPCDRPANEEPKALAFWRTTSISDAFTIFVNSFGSDRLVALPEGGDPVECEAITAEISVAFDRFCSLPFIKDQDRMVVRLIPVKDGRKGRTETVVVDLQ